LRDLQKLQSHFQAYLIQQQSLVQAEINSTPNLAAIARLEIYRDAYYLRFLEVLQQDYSVLLSLVGAEQFNVLGRQYIDSHPSQYRSIRWFGRDMARFIQHSQMYTDQPWLSEMAQFEWLLMEAFDAEDSTVVAIDEMVTLAPEKWPELRFILQPSLRKVHLQWNIVSLWQASKEGATVLPEQTIKPTNCIIWRKEYDVQFCLLTEDEMYMTNAMAEGETFAAICASLCAWKDEESVAMHAALLLKRFITDNLIARLESDCDHC
jgi:hypothetical protein